MDTSPLWPQPKSTYSNESTEYPSSHDVPSPGSLDEMAFRAVLNSGTYFTRTTVCNKVLTYVLKIVQQPGRARRARIVDPPPVVSLVILETRGDCHVEITFSYEAKFFLFAILEAAPTSTHSIRSTLNHASPIPTSGSVASGTYLDRPQEAIYFVFPDLSIENEGNYRLSFNLYERPGDAENRDHPTGSEHDVNDRIHEHSSEVIAPCDEFIYHASIKSSIFTVFKAKSFPGLTQGTVLSRLLIEQGVRIKISKPLARLVEKGDTKQDQQRNSDTIISSFEKLQWAESIFGKPDFEVDGSVSSWKDSAYASRKDSMSSIGTLRDRLASPDFDENFSHASGVLSDSLEIHHAEKTEYFESTTTELDEEPIPHSLPSNIEPKAIMRSSLNNSSRVTGRSIWQPYRNSEYGWDPAAFDATNRVTGMTKEAIWSHFIRAFPPTFRAEIVALEDRGLGQTITPKQDELLSHVVKREAHKWWLTHSLHSWKDILPPNSQDTNLGLLGGKIFSRWHEEFINGRRSSGWLDSTGPLLENDTGSRLVDYLVVDISRRLNKDWSSTHFVRKTQPGTSSSTQKYASDSTTTHSESSQPKQTPKKRHRENDVEEDGSKDDDPNRDGKVKRRRKNADQYSRYLICTEFAVSQDPACPNCFFGAWPSVDRLKQDHLIKIHNFDSSLMKIDKGGTESEKWWRLFDKIHPGFREDNPNAFIPGPLWEDRIAHNAYNKVLSKAMKEAERIRQRSTKALTTQFQDLMERQQSIERRELRQMILGLISPNRNTTSSNNLTPEPEIEGSAQNTEYDTYNGLMTPLPQQSEVASTPLSRPEIFAVPFSFQSPDPFLPIPSNRPHSNIPAPNFMEANFGTDTDQPFLSPEFSPDEPPRNQMNPPPLPPIATRSASIPVPSEIAYENSHLSETSVSSYSSDHIYEGPFGKVCRCRLHSTECTTSSKDDGSEFCVGCSGWFPWSAMAEPFFHH